MQFEIEILPCALVLVVAVVALIFVLARALVTGLIKGIDNEMLSRSKDPAAFWLMFSLGLLTTAFFIYLLAR